LFIDDIHILNSKYLIFINKLLESNFSPLFILATNRINVMNLKSLFQNNVFFGFTEKCLTIPVHQLNRDDFFKIISIKGKNLKIILSGLSIFYCAKIAEFTSLRFVILLINTSKFFVNYSRIKFINLPVLLILNFFFFHFKESKNLINYGKFLIKIYRIF
jgi:DNA helicase TIP49 (TBP-interacting protein)